MSKYQFMYVDNSGVLLAKRTSRASKSKLLLKLQSRKLEPRVTLVLKIQPSSLSPEVSKTRAFLFEHVPKYRETHWQNWLILRISFRAR